MEIRTSATGCQQVRDQAILTDPFPKPFDIGLRWGVANTMQNTLLFIATQLKALLAAGADPNSLNKGTAALRTHSEKLKSRGITADFN